MNPAFGILLRILGIGALVAGGLAVAVAALASRPHAHARGRKRRRDKR